MKHKIVLSLAVTVILSLFAGCAAQGNAADQPLSVAGDGDKLTVYASFYQMADFAEKIGGDKVALTTLVPAGTEPHDWEPAAADLAGLEKADVLVYNGAGMEHWVEQVLSSVSNKKLLAVEAARGIALLPGVHEEDEEAESGEAEAAYDPHVWLSPKNAKAMLNNIKDALAQADPNNKAYYQENCDRFTAELDKLDKEFSDTLAPLPNKDVVVAHQAFGYLCAEYGLNQVAIEGLSPDSEPDPARIAEIIDFVKQNQVKVIFFEELVSPKVAQTVADATGASTDVLNPLEGLTDEQLAAGEDYFSIMRKNLQALQSALQ